MVAINMTILFEIEIPKQIWLSGNHVAYRRTDRQMHMAILEYSF